jgi:selenocysteine lyase/cysteine desulfurase
MSALTDAEVEEIRAQFPALEKYTYFTSNGLGVLPQRSVLALQERLDQLSRNAIISTLFGNGPLIEETRARVARLLGCEAGEVAFCRNTSEGILWAAQSLRVALGDEVLVAQGEYPANVLPWMAQESRGLVTRLLPQRDRRITPALVQEAWTQRTRVLAVSFVQYNSGFRADLKKLADVVHERGGLLVCDAIQGLGALQLDVRKTGVDVLAAGTHKWLLGLQGLGVFYCSEEALGQLDLGHIGPGSLIDDRDPEDPDAPYDRNFVPDTRRFEEGTRNYLAIAALNESLALMEEIGPARIEARIQELTDYLVAEAEARGCRVHSPRGPGEWSGIVLFEPPAGGPKATDLVAAMHGQRITINARENCIHMGVHFYNTRKEVDRVLHVLDEGSSSRR